MSCRVDKSVDDKIVQKQKIPAVGALKREGKACAKSFPAKHACCCLFPIFVHLLSCDRRISILVKITTFSRVISRSLSG